MLLVIYLATHGIYRDLLLTDVANNMPRNNVRADSRFQKVVEYQINNPNLEVRDTMKLANFSLREREDKAKYDGSSAA
jgi:hypothetical protein